MSMIHVTVVSRFEDWCRNFPLHALFLSKTAGDNVVAGTSDQQNNNSCRKSKIHLIDVLCMLAIDLLGYLHDTIQQDSLGSDSDDVADCLDK